MLPPPDPTPMQKKVTAKRAGTLQNYKPGQKIPYNAKPSSVTVYPYGKPKKYYAVPNFKTKGGGAIHLDKTRV